MIETLALSLLLAADAGAPPPAPVARPGEWPEVRPGRPSFSDTTTPTEKGAIGVDFGGLFTAGAFSTPVMLRYGVSDSADLRLSLSQAFHPDAGLDGFTLMVKKMLLAPEEGSVGLAFAPFVSAPTVRGDELASAGVVLLTTWPIGEGWQVEGNLVALVAPEPGQDASLEIDPVVAMGFPLVGPVGGFAETYALLPSSGAEPSLAFAAGLGIEVCAPFVLDASVAFGGGPDLPPWAVQVGGTIEFWGPGDG